MRGIVKRYGGVQALAGADFAIYPREIHALVGDNAAGKSSLIRVLSTLLIADSGTRVLARVDLATRQKTVVAESYQGKRFNSPNDLVVARNGAVYFTDPPYGLAGVQKSPLRELTYTGVFRVTPDNQVHLIADNLSPNGIALSPDNRTLYATDNSGWVAIDLDGSGMPIGQRQFVASESVGGARGDGGAVRPRAPQQPRVTAE